MKSRTICSALFVLCTLALLVALGTGHAAAADAAADVVPPPPDVANPSIVVAPDDLFYVDKPVRPPVDTIGTDAPGGIFSVDKPVRPPVDAVGTGVPGELYSVDKPVRPPVDAQGEATPVMVVAMARPAAMPAAPVEQASAGPFGDPQPYKKPVRPPTGAAPAAGGAGGTQRVGVLLELGGPPAAEVYAQLLAARRGAAANGPGNAGAVAIDAALQAELAAATQAAVAANTAAQADLIAALEPLGATVIFQAQRVHNGVAVRVDAGQVALLANLPGVVAVRPLTPKTPGNAASVPFIGAPAVWQGMAGVPGLTGEGVRVAIIDTGIDYLHRDFGGPGTGYGENDPTVAGDVVGFPSAKVVGGYDFSGDYYSPYAASGEVSEYAFPDPDPMDCYGHGTHVAGTAAGYGVTTVGTTYTGAYNTTTNFAGMSIGPGVAPRAALYAVRVFDCFGSSSDLLDMGIEYAVDPNMDGDLGDHVDVINMSFGIPFGVEYDTSAVAAERAAAAGVIVVISAGNNGDAYFVNGSPAIATRSLSVAATGHLSADVSFEAYGPDTMAYFSSRGLRRGDSLLKPDISAPGVDVASAYSGSGDGAFYASGTSMAAPHVTGVMALLRQLHPAWSVEELKALAMNTTVPVRITGDYTAPLAALSRAGSGRADALAAARAPAIVFDTSIPGGVSASFGAPAVVGSYQAEHQARLANKSSTPVTYTVTYAPLSDMAGVEFTAGIGPQVTLAPGAAATFPVRLNADASQLENNRDPSVDPAITPGRFWPNEEAGLLLFWPQAGTFSARLAPENETPVPLASTAAADVAARFDPLAGTLYYTATLKSAASSAVQSLVLGWGHAGVTAAHTQTLPGGAGMAVNVPVTGQTTLASHDALLLAGGQLFVQIRTANHPLGELRGQMMASAPLLRLPLHAAPRAAATLHTQQSSLDFTAAQPVAVLTRTLTLAGADLPGTNPPTQTQSLAGMFELVLRSPNIKPYDEDWTAPDYYDSADLRYLGITSDYAQTGSISETTVSFAVAAWAPWETPATVEYAVHVRRPGDESPSIVVYTTMASVQGYYLDDGFEVAVFDWTDWESFITPSYPLNGISPARYRTEAFNSGVMVLSVPATDLGLSESQPMLHYQVRSSVLFKGLIDATPEYTYDVHRPGLILPAGVEGSALIPAADGASYPIVMNVANYIANGSRGLLLLQMHNEAGAQAEVVDLPFTWPYKQFLPVVGDQRQ